MLGTSDEVADLRILEPGTHAMLFFTDRPQRVAGYLAFNVSIIEGLPPDAAGRSALFIDTIGRPMSPGSVAGVHHRYRRREVRRHTP